MENSNNTSWKSIGNLGEKNESKKKTNIYSDNIYYDEFYWRNIR